MAAGGDAFTHDAVLLLGIVVPALLAIAGGTWKALAGLRADVQACKDRESKVEHKLNLMNVCLRLLIPEVKRAAPSSVALAQVRALLDEEWPVDPDTPADMLAALDRLDGARPHLAAVAGGKP